MSTYYENNKEKVKQQAIKWRKENPDKWREIRRNYVSTRKKRDLLFAFRERVKASVKQAIRRQGYAKKDKTAKIIGLSFKNLMTYLWDRFELTYGIPRTFVTLEQVHIDHVIPISFAQSEAEVIKLNHYSNLQFLLIEDNLNKGARIE